MDSNMSHILANALQRKVVIINALRFVAFLVCHEKRPNHAPMDFCFCGKWLRESGLWWGVGGMGGTTFGHFRPHKTLIVNAVSVSFSWNHAPITPQ